MRLGDTIAARATGDTHADRAVVRLSGLDALNAARSLLIDPLPRDRGVRPVRLNITEDTRQWFTAIAIVMLAPASFTGEDTAELVVPGNPFIVRRVLERLRERPNLRDAQPGEFSARAYLNGKLSAEQAEGVGALIAARNADEHAAARQALQGSTGSAYRAAADELAATLALVEAGIDFTDEEHVVAITAPETARRLRAVEQQLATHLGTRGAIDTARISAVLLGPPNAGKSTLFNALLGRTRALVSDTPGTTRDAVRETMPSTASAATRGLPDIELADLAGIDHAFTAEGPAEAASQHAARNAIAHAHLLLWCDPTARFDAPDIAAAIAQHPANPTVIRVHTKADLPAPPHAKPHPANHVCALDGFGIDALRRAIADAAAHAAGRSDGRSAVLARHRAALTATIDALRAAIETAQHDTNHNAHIQHAELVAHHLRAALDELGQIAGDISPDDVIGRIFATFCIGK